LGLLLQDAGQKAVQTVGQTGNAENYKGLEIGTLHQKNDNGRREDNTQKG
jgi:hypothetical protein